MAQAVGTVNSHGLESNAFTNLLYNGESFDSRIGQLYLRARWYDMHRFTALDPFGGNANDPLSFNKYGFVHGDPVMGIDPSGLQFSLGGKMVSTGIGMAIAGANHNVQMSVLGAAQGSAVDGNIYDFVANFPRKLADAFREQARNSVIAMIPVVGTLYGMYQIGSAIYGVVRRILSEDDIAKAINDTGSNADVLSSGYSAMAMARPSGAASGLRQLLLFPVRSSEFKSIDDFLTFINVAQRRINGRDNVLGSVVSSTQWYDAKAHKLAQRLGGVPQSRFERMTGEFEFDAISDSVIAQSKPRASTGGSKWADQAKLTFEIAAQTGRRAHFHFESMPARDVLNKLRRYSERYKVPMDVEIGDFS